MKKYFKTAFFLSLLVFNSCKKEKQDEIPYVYVDYTIQLSNPQYIDLNATNGWVYLSGLGSRGIIVYRKSNTEFKAYDRHCPYQPENSCGQVSVNSSSVYAVDTCCHSEFILSDGSVMKGPAVSPLKQYQTTYNGSTLRIFN